MGVERTSGLGAFGARSSEYRFITPVTRIFRVQHAYGKNTGTLRVTGVVRGAPMSANRLVHIPNYGDYQVEKVRSLRSLMILSELLHR